MAIAAASLFFSGKRTIAQAQEALPSPAAVVKPQTYVSLEPVPRGKTFEIAVVVEIARGFHMNSHKPTDPYLIATTLTPQVPAGFEILDTIYPDGRKEKFTFSPNKPLDVYTGKVTLRLRVSAHADAALGATSIPITLRYQACNDTTCLQPVKIPVDAKFEVAAAGAKSRAAHTEIFSSAPPRS
ncbi:MAG: protein-disulfide reductase DsbD domain-containing protein [Candidatus Acidiferrales bacterium]